MRLVAVTRILNEDDIVEAFTRHHAAVVDHHVFLDNGSVDRTLEILAGLAGEGLGLTVLQNTAAHFAEPIYNTNLFQIAATRFAADWVVHLDTDEFLDERALAGGLRERLHGLPEEIGCLRLPIIDYQDMTEDDPTDLLVPRRMRTRDRIAPQFNPSVTVRAALAGRGVRIESGNHDAQIGEVSVPRFDDDRLRLAHYPRRNAWQWLAKTVAGRLKVLAAGRTVQSSQASLHYVAPFETVRDRPEDMLRSPGFLYPSHDDRELVIDPITYLGGPLRFTRASDPAMKAIRTMTAYAEQLATQHATLIDSNESIRLQTDHAAGFWQHLF